MKDFVARLIAYLLIGSFCLMGPLCLALALGSAVQRAVLIYSGTRAEATVIATRTMGSTRVTYAPVFQFTAGDGHTYVVSSDVYGRESAFRYGERIRILYPQLHPESARIDAFAPLWTFPLVVGVVGAGFSVIPALGLVNWIRRRRTGRGAPDTMEADRSALGVASPGFRWALGALLAGTGVFLLLVGLGVAAADSGSLRESRGLVTSLGALLAASGVLIGQWVAPGTRLYHALGGAAITSMAAIFGWVALYGEAAGFSGGVGIGGVAVASSGSVTPARIAFGIAALVCGLASLPAWRQVLRNPPAAG